MNDKQMLLMSSGMKLFADKGYHNTSVQEIAAAAGMSKGSFYLYFQSKEDFLTKVIQYYYKEIINRLEAIKNHNDFDARASFAAQISVLANYVYTYKDFIRMHIRENIPAGQYTDQLVNQMKVHNFHWLKDNLLAIYGPSVNDCLIDTIIQSDGLMNGYFKWMVTDGLQIDTEQTGNYIVERIDNLIQGMLADSSPPLITAENLPDIYTDHFADVNGESLMDLIEQAKAAVYETDLSADRQAELLEAADMIAVSAKEEQPSTMVIKGMLAYFQAEPALKPFAVKIADRLQIKLIQ
ncbi:putative HTH-type transcriptional regulator YuxN [Lentibacillus sp. JNUCC-1]|uniref:TetR/AcrR family transcriptional regulator n=1 Tax=Lentibacillus sp. JNUCC-1 TaxID=2654513 RepID=UPI0012E784B6|nr:TetR/AcrR family transcriptional regulator [Lentibacillus sp. JNUCC-1]MUV37356.1 putative HTH-type transcriptional regulator YuxN [Lentibacillus sp. JNUCC-1]